MTSNSNIAWIAADWGTTNLRIWALNTDGEIAAHRSSDKGMGKLAREEFEPALLELINDILPSNGVTPVVVCGMAGSRQGWSEAPYIETPCAPPSLRDGARVGNTDPRIEVVILPGIKQMAPPDVMRGEETQIAGFLASQPGFSGTLCLPGTHTKWVAIKDGIITKFRTCMTGETFALLSKQSVLRHGLGPDATNRVAFTAAVKDITKAPARLAGELFGIRAAGLVAGQTPEEATSRLSGLLIGAELAAIQADFDLTEPSLLGSDAISEAYAAALGALGLKSSILDAETITLKGLTLAYQSQLKETS